MGIAPVAQWIRASGYGPEGRGFESLRAYSLDESVLSMGVPLGLADTFEQQRNRQAIEKARPHLPEDEDVLHWVRVKESRGRGEGLAFITERRVLLRWNRDSESPQTFTWTEVEAWGIEADAKGGPILCVESEDASAVVQFPARSGPVAGKVSDFLQGFAGRVPSPRRTLRESDSDRFSPLAEVAISPERRTVWTHTKRIAATVVGIVLIVFAILIIPVPGPWSILLTIAGLAVLASEYDWAKDVQDWAKDRYQDARRKIKERKQKSES